MLACVISILHVRQHFFSALPEKNQPADMPLLIGNFLECFQNFCLRTRYGKVVDDDALSHFFALTA
jgi:hypothetical protein